MTHPHSQYFRNYPVWTALVTPFLSTGEIDYSSLEKCVRLQVEAQNALVLLGSTGENLALGLRERQEILSFMMQLKPRVPVMVGVPGYHLKEALEWMEYAQKLEVNAFLLVTPIYAKPGHYGQTAWFKALLDHARIPCMLYNVPSRAGVALNLETVKDLSSHPSFQGIKEASGDVAQFKNYMEACKAQFNPHGPPLLFSGDDALTWDFARAGGHGLVSVASNAWPKTVHSFVQACLENKKENLPPSWDEAFNSLFYASNPVPVKALLHQNKWIHTPECRPPLSYKDLTEDQLKKILTYNELYQKQEMAP